MTATRLGGRYDCWGLISEGHKRTFAPDPGCEWDIGGGFTKSGPGDSQMHSPRSCFLSVSYGPISGRRVAARGKWRWTGATPPFCCPVRARGCCAIHICAAPPGGGRSRLNYPCREGSNKAGSGNPCSQSSMGHRRPPVLLIRGGKWIWLNARSGMGTRTSLKRWSRMPIDK